jgi:hypothetical protein
MLAEIASDHATTCWTAPMIGCVGRDGTILPTPTCGRCAVTGRPRRSTSYVMITDHPALMYDLRKPADGSEEVDRQLALAYELGDYRCLICDWQND